MRQKRWTGTRSVRDLMSRPRRQQGARLVAVGFVASALAIGGCVPSTPDEVAMGNSYAQQIEQQLPIIRDPEVARYINVLGDSIARVVDDRQLTWRFSVVDQPDINAFAVPGGHIYIYRGLIEKTSNMSELAGVLGHEIAHITQRHSMKQMAAAQRTNIVGTAVCVVYPSVCQGAAGAVAQTALSAGFAKFSRDDEREADRFGVTYVTRAGIDPRGMPSMFRILMRERQRNPSAVDAFFASHPIEETRVAETEAEIEKLDQNVVRSTTRDSRSFQAFKTRLSTLPRTPAKR